MWCVGVCGWVRAFVVDRRDRSIENCIHFIKHTNVRFGLEGEELELDRKEPEDGVDGEDEEDEHVQRREELLVVGRLGECGVDWCVRVHTSNGKPECIYTQPHKHTRIHAQSPHNRTRTYKIQRTVRS